MRNREYVLRPDGSIGVLNPDGSTAGLTLKEAVQAQLEQARLRDHERAEHTQAGQVPRRRAVVPKSNTGGLHPKTRVFLRAIADAGKLGIDADALTKELGLATVNGLSACVRDARRFVAAKADAKPFDHYVWKQRSRSRGSVWYGSPERLKEIGLM